ncbi:hypothetical protein [Simiduia aestuariiviva]|uniref:DUF2232 domain-containing protein n=1 Tax=Simiduia aestuariiviva TaxID=1510459 RepID=A0A839USZ1_9GAMM|nr:hypothetical protein [Simiduia aestuariiviva]MBB3169570.1 hypothetical protein [Simiduia aestuariiviva]
MRGRLQAATVALIGSWFPLVSPAVVGLVSLRKGAFEGTLTLVWAMLPALFTLMLSGQGLSEMGPLMPFVTLIGLVVVFAAAQVLRITVSWSRTLTGLVALAVAGAGLLAVVLPNPVQSLTEALGNMLRDLQSNAPEGAAIANPDSTFVLGLVAYVIALSGLGSLLLARWAQAKLYNPGGFRQELHQLRLAPAQALVCMAAATYCLLQPVGYQAWVSVFSLPLLLAGIALVHAVVHARKKGIGWLVMLYLGLFLIEPLSMAIVLLGLADTWLNLRNRLNVHPPSSD